MDVTILLLEDDAVLARSLQRLLKPISPVQIASSAMEAYELLAGSTRWRALLLDVFVPGGTGFEVLTYARSLGITAPALIVTAKPDLEMPNKALALYAEFMIKPVASELMLGWLDRVLPERRIAHVVERDARKYHLTKTQADVLLRGALGETRAVVAGALHITLGTLQNHISSLLHKTSDDTFETAIARVRGEALEG